MMFYNIIIVNNNHCTL